MRDEKSIPNFSCEVLKGRDHLSDLVVVGKIILKFTREETGYESIYWIFLSQDGI
jgi:hypothetical protein